MPTDPAVPAPPRAGRAAAPSPPGAGPPAAPSRPAAGPPAAPPHPAGSDGAAPAWADALVVTDDGSRTLRSARYGETYRSSRGAHAEARHVFVEATGVGRRLAAGEATSVLEVGLGAATNLAWTAAAALAGGAPLRYQAWEPDPLPAAAWAVLGLEAVVPEAFLAELLAARAAWGQLRIGDVRVWCHGPVRLELVVAPIATMAGAAGDAEAAVDPGGEALVDAVYLDAFSPRVNPDAWTPPVLAGLARRLRPGGALATYSVAGAVRRALAAAGLEVEKLPGPAGGKREVLRARRTDPAADPRRPDPGCGGPPPAESHG